MDQKLGRIKILVVCGMGVGSSYFVMQNVLNAVQTLNWQAEVENTDIFNAAALDADVIIGADYLVELVESEAKKIPLDDLLDEQELIEKLKRLKERFDG